MEFPVICMEVNVGLRRTN